MLLAGIFIGFSLHVHSFRPRSRALLVTSADAQLAVMLQPLLGVRLHAVLMCPLSSHGSNKNPSPATPANEGQISAWSLSSIVTCPWGIGFSRNPSNMISNTQ